MNSKKHPRRPLSRRVAKRRTVRRLHLEALEDRCLLAVFSPAADAEDGSAESLRAAVVASQSNQADDTIELGEGIYVLRLGDLRIDEPNTQLRIEGAGADRTVIKIEGDSRAFDVDFDARLNISGLAILSGHEDEGGQIRSAGTVMLSDALLQSGMAIQGGSIFNGGDLTLTNVELVANEAGAGGAIWNHAGATLTASDTRWLQNVTSKRLGAEIKSPAQVGIVLAGSESRNGIYGVPPRGGTALFNAGSAHLQSVEIAGNLSETGAVIHSVGDAAQLRIEDSLVYENESTTQSGEDVAPSFLVAMGGNVDLIGTAIFNNSSKTQYGGTIHLSKSSIDMNHVSIFDNYSPGHGLKAFGSSVRMEHVTFVRSGTRGIEIFGAPHTLIDITASAIDAINVEPRGGQFRSGGGNRTVFARSGFGSVKPFDQPTDLEASNDIKEKYFFTGQSFDFLPAGIYQGQVALPPTGTSQLIDVLPSGEDAGAFEFVTGLEREASLPHVSASGLTVQEDGAPLLIDSLVPHAIDAVAAHGMVSKNDQGQLVYRTEMNFHGHDRLVVQGPDGQMQSWAVVVAPQADPPTIEDYTVTVLGRSEVLGLETPGATERTDLNAVTASYQSDSLFAPDGNPSAGPDLGSEIVAQGFVIDGKLDLGPDNVFRLPEELGGQLPYAVSGSESNPKVNLNYVPEPGFSGTDTRTVRVVNSSGLSADATATFNVLDPAAIPQVGRVTAVFLDQNLQPTESVRVGETFYIEYFIEDIRDGDHPLQTLQRDYLAIRSIFNIGGAPLRIATVKLANAANFEFYGNGEVPIAPQAIGGFLEVPATPPAQLDDSHLRVDANLLALERRSGAFYRVAVAATGVGTITAETQYLNASGLGMQGTIPYDWFELVSDSVDVIPSQTNVAQPEDVNQDGFVSAVDAVIVINTLNEMSHEAESPNRVANSPDSYLRDVNGDGEVSPIDALRIVNYLNRHAVVTVAAEGEASLNELPATPYTLQVRDDYRDVNVHRAEAIDKVMQDEEKYLHRIDLAVNVGPEFEAAHTAGLENLTLDATDDENDVRYPRRTGLTDEALLAAVLVQRKFFGELVDEFLADGGGSYNG